ncbi:NYN domain-containing protein [bacterium]|nr:NYN domain-containing protein [bacterium]
MERICIFIDGSNFYYQLKESKTKGKLDYFAFAQALAGSHRQLIRTYYYVCPPSDTDHASYDDQQKFFSYLKNTPYLQLVFGDLEVRGDTHVEKGVDVRIAVDMVSLAYAEVYDTAILVSNDADLVPAVEKIKPLGKHVEYAYITKKTVQLVEACDTVLHIDREIFQQSKPK